MATLLPESLEAGIRAIEIVCSPALSEARVTEETSQSERSLNVPNSPPTPLGPALLGFSSSQSSPLPSKKRKARSYSSWTLEHF
ncbi:hypothetical protein N7471_010598 [Penicillium samsonianum]|uniref:uncharacterized protein n=1 Tax=Penicillium samsonianum TaxID=1882272 RepID=UPI00254858A8|nr:uncharacterized protein N7471_010598 [Penicillium samsonianum]KAJ6126105.1 hypothetical protein N7471_010598 [Penicillium samsonianum]